MGHDKLDILVLDTLRIDFLAIVLLLLLVLTLVLVAGVVVTGVVVLSGLAGELLGGSGLGAGVEVLNLGLTKDTIRLSDPALQLLGVVVSGMVMVAYMYVLLLGDL